MQTAQQTTIPDHMQQTCTIYINDSDSRQNDRHTRHLLKKVNKLCKRRYSLTHQFSRKSTERQARQKCRLPAPQLATVAYEFVRVHVCVCVCMNLQKSIFTFPTAFRNYDYTNSHTHTHTHTRCLLDSIWANINKYYLIHSKLQCFALRLKITISLRLQ